MHLVSAILHRWNGAHIMTSVPARTASIAMTEQSLGQMIWSAAQETSLVAHLYITSACSQTPLLAKSLEKCANMTDHARRGTANLKEVLAIASTFLMLLMMLEMTMKLIATGTGNANPLVRASSNSATCALPTAHMTLALLLPRLFRCGSAL